MAVVKVVKYDGGPDVFAWKYPSQELGTWTQLIVNESQEAALFQNGIALDVFGPGRHTLETENIPLLSRVTNLPFGGRSPFAAEVWFINKTHSLDIKWGTATPIQLQDPQYNILIPVRAYGQFGIRIDDSKRFLLKLVGTLPVLDKESLMKFFRGIYMAKVKNAISSYLIHKKIGIMEINAYIGEISTHVLRQVKPPMEEYGIEVINFFVNDISVPENDPSVARLRQALVQRAEINIISDSAAGGLSPADVTECKQCRSKVQKDKRFCPNCGHDMQSAMDLKPIRCSKCSAVLSPSVKFCPECGDKYNPCPSCGADVMEKDLECHACGYTMPKPCASCGAPIAPGVKYCSECGASTSVKKCGECGFGLTDGSKFCPECGKEVKEVPEKGEAAC